MTAVTTAYANPIMTGEGKDLSLADKVFCEAKERGSKGNVDRLTVTGFNPSVIGVASVYNPEKAQGGTDDKTDYEIKKEIAHTSALLAQSPKTALETIAKQADADLLRLCLKAPTDLNQVNVGLLSRGLGAMSAAEKDAIESYIEDRIPYGISINASDVTLTAVTVSFSASLTTGYTDKQVWNNVVNALAAYLDLRKWAWGSDVDNSKLLKIVLEAEGIASIDTSTFSPSSSVTVGAESLPYLASVTITNRDSGLVTGAVLSQTY